MIDLLPSERDRHGIAEAVRGMDDGMSGAPEASSSPIYGDAYRRGRLMADAETGRCMVALSSGCRCPRCDTHFVGDMSACGCEEAGDHAMVRGAYVIRGPNVRETGFQFMASGELRVLIATGLPLLDMDGADISCQIQLSQ